jgi:LuxR family maltose regulon positive regulatory protein
MAEPARTPPRADAGGSGGLLATKLFVPPAQPGFVGRPRLLEGLDAGLGRGLLLVCAPAGFGKTALLADWARQGRRPVAWLSLDGGDNDPARFWRHVVAALDRVRPGIAEQVAPLLGPPPPPSFEGLVSALINELAAEPDGGEAVLVLDDYHLIEVQPVHSSLGFLLEHRPPDLRLLLASRADPPLALARLRARGQLGELREHELRFTPDEAAALLRETVGPDLPDAAVAALAARTEGWAAGLQLAGLSLRGHPDPPGFVASFSGSHRYVLDYLAEEVLDRQPEPLRAFLLETSVLDRLSGALCDAVTGRADGQAMLEQVERANLFLVPLDEVRGWWRFHHLFADLLRARLQQEQPERVAELHRAAAAWTESHGLADEAVRHALAAGDAVWAARLIEQHFDELVYARGQGATVRRWLAAVPAELAGSRPRLLLARAAMALHDGHVEEVEVFSDAAERAAADAADEPFAPSAGTAGSMLVNVPAGIALHRTYLAALRGDGEATAALASQALAETRKGEQMLRAIAQGHLAIAERLRGRVAQAEQRLASSVAGWQAAGQPRVAALGCHGLSQLQRAQGRLDAAVATCQQALEFTTSTRQAAPPTAGPAHLELAEVAYQQGDLDAAMRHVTEGLARCRRLFASPLPAGLVTLAWIRQAHGDTAGAVGAMDEAGRVAPGSAPSLFNQVPAQRARLLLAQADLAAAERWTKERGLGAGDEPPYHRESEYLVLARVLLAQGQSQQALELLERLHQLAAAQGRLGSVIEIQALRALALAAGGDQPGAVAVLAGTLRQAHHQGYVRVFADEGPPMRALLGRLVTAQRTEQGAARGVPLDYLALLLRAFEQDAASTRPPTTVVPGLVEALSGRELEVLRLLAAGRANQQIAEELVVAPSTVKKHVTHILEKLGAANRTEATARARELGLLP